MPENQRKVKGFADPERAGAVLERLGDCGHDRFWDLLLPEISASADPDRALANLERWLKAPGSIEPRVLALMDNPGFRHRLSFMLGAGQALSDIVIQNPELALILGDPDELCREADVQDLVNEGQGYLDTAISFTHRLDRLRYLKQKTLIRIVWNDLSGAWEPERVWRALSALCDAVIALAARVVWKETGEGPLRVAVLAMGKHGAHELNYSSDIDLIFVAEDDAADIQAHARFCERLGRALAGRMGRGALYRVDLRLRPLGSAGPIVHSATAALNYYRNYAEPWEIQALIRCRRCAGSRRAAAQFLDAVRKEVYRGPRSELFLDSLVEAKQRYEQDVVKRGERDSNVKLGAGGIRDIEFIVQLLQLFLGYEIAELRGAPTVAAIETLEQAGHLSHRHADILRSAYRLLRQVEHRIQLLYDLQAHNLPRSPSDRRTLARLVGVPDWGWLEAELRRVRSQVRGLLENRVPALAQRPKTPSSIAALLGLEPGSPQAETAWRLIENSEDAEAFMREVAGHKDTAERLRLISCCAPRIVPEVGFHRELWDVAFSDEIEFRPEDEPDTAGRMRSRLEEAGADWEAVLAGLLRREFVAVALKEALHRDVRRTFTLLSAIAETALVCSLDRLGGSDIDVIALGRLGGRELLLGSDWDVMLLVREPSDQARAEQVGEHWIRIARRLGLASSYFPLDTRLRPEGSSGLVVRSLAGFQNYSQSAMEAWERLVFTRARSLRGWRETTDAITTAVYRAGWGPAQEGEIASIRRRIHSERVPPWQTARDLKLGEGFLLDIEWLCGLCKLRLGERAPTCTNTLATLEELADANVLTCEARAELADAALFLSRMRDVLFLLDLDSDSVLPENPEKLERIARSLGLRRANDVLESVETRRSAVLKSFRAVAAGGVA